MKISVFHAVIMIAMSLLLAYGAHLAASANEVFMGLGAALIFGLTLCGAFAVRVSDSRVQSNLTVWSLTCFVVGGLGQWIGTLYGVGVLAYVIVTCIYLLTFVLVFDAIARS